MEKIVEIKELNKTFLFNRTIKEVILGKNKRGVRAVDGVSFSIQKGKNLGVVGESGCGKTTLGKLLVRLYEPTSGRIFFKGKDIGVIKGKEVKYYRKKIQMIFQNPYTAINPRFTIYNFVVEPLLIYNIGENKGEREKIVYEMLNKVKLNPPEKFLSKYAHQLSGGERQRAVVARALILRPEFVVADEPASMLDVSLRAGILNLLKQLVEELDLTIMYISHDISLIRYLCDVIMVVYLGKIVEIGHTREVINNPLHPYTQAMIAAVPVPDPNFKYQKVKIKGVVPTVPQEPVPGCIFVDRCPYAVPTCKEEHPPQVEIDEGHIVYCHRYRGGFEKEKKDKNKGRK